MPIETHIKAKEQAMNKLIGLAMVALSFISHADPLAIKVSNQQSSFVVNLEANPTTGYQWEVVSYDKALLTLKSSVYQRPDTKLIGAGGQMLFTFTVNKGKTHPKSTKLVFKYARPWEKDTGTLQKVVVNFSPH